MIQEEKDLLIKDLSARLLYKVKFSFKLWDEEKQEEVNTVCTMFSVNTDGYCEALEESGHIPLDFAKPYLRPLSSMTEEEHEEYRKYVKSVNGFTYNINCSDLIDWFNRKMFDYRGLIPKGLALEAPEDMYEHETKLDFNRSGSRIYVGCKIRSKENPDVILRIISDDCHGDEFECSNGSVLSLKQIEKYYDIIT